MLPPKSWPGSHYKTDRTEPVGRHPQKGLGLSAPTLSLNMGPPGRCIRLQITIGTGYIGVQAVLVELLKGRTSVATSIFISYVQTLRRATASAIPHLIPRSG